MYKQAIEPLLELSIAGFNTCLLILGESGSGKAYTVAGESMSKSGVVPIVMDHLFSRIGEGK